MKKTNLELNYLVGIRHDGGLEECIMKAMDLKGTLLENGLYSTGPVILKTGFCDHNFCNAEIMLPICTRLEIDDKHNLFFINRLAVPECYMKRMFVLEEGLESCLHSFIEEIENNQLPYEETFYIILIEVFGEIILDIYVPVKKG